MKSRTSYFDSATFRMELRRFAPVWILYTLGTLLTTGFLLTASGYGTQQITEAVQRNNQVTCLYNLAYAFLLGQLLFGDLYSSRLCYSIHALPITRGGFFGTQILLGFLSHLIPSLLNAAMMLLYVKEFRVIVVWWLLANALQYLWFFGIAVFSAICAGSRFGMMVMDGILNFWALPVYWFHSRLYIPLLHGLESGFLSTGILRLAPFSLFFSPIFLIEYGTTNVPIEQIKAYSDGPVVHYMTTQFVKRVYLAEYVPTFALYALIGIVAIWAALKLYRKRPLESAGDLLAFDKLKPLYLGLFTMCVGCGFHMVPHVFNTVNYSVSYWMLFLGLVVGYSVGLMLMKRQINVFTPKSFLPLGCLLVLVLVSLILTGLDVLGISRKLPDVDQIQSASLVTHYYGAEYTTEDPGEILQLRAIQEHVIQDHTKRESEMSLTKRIFANELDDVSYSTDEELIRVMPIRIVYQMRDGSLISRWYNIPETAPDVPVMKKLFSKPEVLFSRQLDNEKDAAKIWEQLNKNLTLVRFRCDHVAGPFDNGMAGSITDPEEIRSLLAAIAADCEEGTMSQYWVLHESENGIDQLYFLQPLEQNPEYFFSLDVFSDSQNTRTWLTEHGYHQDRDPSQSQ